MLAAALRMYRRRAGAFLVTTAIALLPAHVLKTALVAAIRYRVGPTETSGPAAWAPGERQQRVRGSADAGELSGPPAQETRLEHALAAISDLPTARGLHRVLAGSLLLAASLPLLAAGVYLALAALLPLVLAQERGARMSASDAWALAGARIGPLFGTIALATALSMLGTVVLVVPGLALLLGFCFAAPATLIEGRRGLEALRRSLALAAGVVPGLIIIALVFAAVRVGAAGVAALLLPGDALVSRLLLEDAISILLFPAPIAALALLYEQARGADSRARGQPGHSQLPQQVDGPDPRQYIRRTSAPG